MEDIIDIIVTETTNIIEITSQPTDEVIDVNIIDNREDVTLNVTPSVVEININSLTGNFGVNWGDITGTLSDQTDLQDALDVKADLVDGKVPSSQLPSYVDDIIEVATYSALPATGETGKIYVVLDTNLIYRWSGSAYIEIKDSSAVWGAITGTLSSQTDLQSALNAKFNNPSGDTTQYIAGDGSLITFPVAGQAGTLVRQVRNTTGATLSKGTIVYINGASGNKPTVTKALATADSTSAQTFGFVQTDISNNSNGYVVCNGDLIGLDTSAVTEGTQLYLSSTTAGAYTTTKQVAPAHLVYVGVVTRSHPTLGQIEVKIQNGYEIDELHDVLITSKANNDGLFYESSSGLWKNKSIATVLGYTPEQPLTFSSPLSRSTNTVSIPVASNTQNGYLSSSDWSTFNGKQAALSGTGFIKISGTTISYDNKNYAQTSGLTDGYLPAWSSALLGGSLTDSFISYSSNITNVAGMGLQSLNGLKISGYYNLGVTGQKIVSNDETTGYAFIDFSNTGGRFYLGVNRSTTNGLMSGASAYSTLLTSVNATNLEFGTNTTKRLTIDGSTGAATFTSSVTASSLIKSGGTSSQFLKADGSVDSNTYLTTSSASSTYLPLSGGTLTGALNGTSATFSSDVTAGDGTGSVSLIINRGAAGNSNGLRFRTAGTNNFYIGSGATGANTDLEIYNHNTATTNLKFAYSTGAATFSSSVTATIGYFGSSTTTGFGGVKLFVKQSSALDYEGLVIQASSNSDSVTIAHTGTIGRIATTYGSGGTGTFTDLALATSGTDRLYITSSGNVGIGTTSPSYAIDVITSGAQAARFATSGTNLYTAYRANNIDVGYIGNGYGTVSGGSTTDMGINASNNLVFSTTGALERMRITSGGNVGIGTTSPNAGLSIVAPSSATALSLWGRSGDNYSALRFQSNTGATTYSTIYTDASNLIFENGGSERMRITSGGDLIFSNSNSSKIQFYNAYSGSPSAVGLALFNTSGTTVIGLNANGGGIYTASLGTGLVYSNGGNLTSTNPSDFRLKKDIKSIEYGLNDILKLRPVSYNWKDDKINQGIQFGFIAQEVQEIMPDAIKEFGEETKFLGLEKDAIYATLVKAIQELKAELDTLKNK